MNDEILNKGEEVKIFWIIYLSGIIPAFIYMMTKIYREQKFWTLANICFGCFAAALSWISIIVLLMDTLDTKIEESEWAIDINDIVNFFRKRKKY